MRFAFAAFASVMAIGAAELRPIDEAGYTRTVAGYKGKVVLVNFWATYCVPCRKEMPALVALQQRLAGRGFQLLTVSADEPESISQASAFLDKTKSPAPSFLKRTTDDEKFYKAVDSKWLDGALPASFLYDRQGKKVRAFFGELNIQALEEEIRKRL
jgi:thiol-disulfide isomerase/thioredoxin